jgi:phage protein U
VLSLPDPITAEATGPGGAAVSYTATAIDNVDGSITPTCSPASGSTFPITTTQVTCSATDRAGNTGSNSFTVTVQDITRPVVSVPSDITVEANVLHGATVSFTSTATDTVDSSVAVTCNPASGSTFPIGITQVTCSATDHAGNTGSNSFSVTVQDRTPPALSLPSQPITAEATGASGATVSYTASATDLVDGNVAIQCAPASGSTFAIAATTVTCSATDAHGNPASGTFSITVQDTTAPNLSGIPQNIANVHITSDAGAIVSYASATATDIVDGSVNVVCDPTSGSLFAIGTKQVTCSATDAHSNTATGTFSVQVIAPTVGFQFLQPVNDPAGDSVVKIGSTLPVKFTMRFADDGSSYGGCTNCRISMNGPSGTTTAAVDEAILTTPADSGVLFRYDPTGQQYIYNMGSKTLKEGKYTLTASFDGIAPNHSVLVAYRK